MVPLASAALVGTCSLAGTAAYGAIDGWFALQFVLLAGVCGSVGFLGLLVRRNSAQMSLLRRGLDRHTREVVEVAGENRAELFARADDLSRQLAKLEHSLLATGGTGAARTDGARVERKAECSDQVARAAGIPSRDECLRELGEILRPHEHMPPLDMGAVSPGTMHRLVGAVRERRPRLVVEFGGGTSTLWLGLALLRFGAGRMVTLEDDTRYADLVRAMVAAHGLDGVIEVRSAGDLGALRDIDLLCGALPPAGGSDGHDLLHPGLLARCAPGALIVPNEGGEDHGTVRERLSGERPDLVIEMGAPGAPVPSRVAS